MGDSDANEKTRDLATDIWSAARANDVERLRQLIADGADIDARDARGHSALMLAAYGGQRKAFDYLLEHGADPNSADHAGNSVLMGAAFKGHLYMVEQLVRAGADVEAVNQSGLDAARFAQVFGQEAIADFLRSCIRATRV